MAAGRPRKFESPEQMQKAIDKYFDRCDSNTKQIVNKQGEVEVIDAPIPYTIEGLCVCLEVCRDTLLNYEKDDGYKEFFDTVKKAKSKVTERQVEMALSGNSNSTLTIFLLKCNQKYNDQPQQEQNQEITVKIVRPEK